MNNTSYKLVHIKPGKLYKFTGTIDFRVVPVISVPLIRVNTGDILMCLKISFSDEYYFGCKNYKKAYIEFLYNNSIVYSSFSETSITEDNIYKWFMPLT